MATEDIQTTNMVHYACGACPMTATVVDNEPSRDAWRDHMLTHEHLLNFRSWCWRVVQLPLEDDQG